MRRALDDAGTVLQRLILEGEAVLARRHVAAGDVIELLDAVQTLMAKPADGVRLIDHHTMLYAAALSQAGKHLAEHNDAKARRFARVVGVLIDDIRDDFSRALAQRPTA